MIDRAPPLDVGVIEDWVIIISDPDDPVAPSVDDVIDADEETWRQLLIAPQPEFEFSQPIGGDAEVVVDFAQDGVAFLEVYLSDAVIADAAEYWKTEINGRIRGRSSATPGDGRGLFGTRLGDAPTTGHIGEEFTVMISTTDGDDETIQTTGEVRLARAP